MAPDSAIATPAVAAAVDVVADAGNAVRRAEAELAAPALAKPDVHAIIHALQQHGARARQDLTIARKAESTRHPVWPLTEDQEAVLELADVVHAVHLGLVVLRVATPSLDEPRTIHALRAGDFARALFAELHLLSEALDP